MNDKLAELKHLVLKSKRDQYIYTRIFYGQQALYSTLYKSDKGWIWYKNRVYMSQCFLCLYSQGHFRVWYMIKMTITSTEYLQWWVLGCFTENNVTEWKLKVVVLIRGIVASHNLEIFPICIVHGTDDHMHCYQHKIKIQLLLGHRLRFSAVKCVPNMSLNSRVSMMTRPISGEAMATSAWYAQNRTLTVSLQTCAGIAKSQNKLWFRKWPTTFEGCWDLTN